LKTGLPALLAALAIAAAAPMLPRAPLPEARGAAFDAWPRTFDGEPLRRISAGPQDEWFARDFPGKVARFAAGGRQVVIRWVNAPTRRLHPASHCFQGSGYQLSPLPMRQDASGALMSCFSATKDGESLRVCEQLRGPRGETWPDVSSWYWSALVAPAGSSWWSYVVVEQQR
jgi:hypothetical protein